MSAISQATSQAIQHGADPDMLANLYRTVGSQNYIGLCQKFVEQATMGSTGHYASASDAWHQQQDRAVKDSNLNGIQPGDAVYFDADQSNQGYGHTGIYTGNGKFISATDNGVQNNPLSDWIGQTGQKVLGYIPHVANQVGNLFGQAGGFLNQAGNWWKQNTGQSQAQTSTNLQPNSAGFGGWLRSHGYNDPNVIANAMANPNTAASSAQDYQRSLSNQQGNMQK